MYHRLFILSISERAPSEQGLVHFPSGNIPLSEAHDQGGWLFCFRERKENRNEFQGLGVIDHVILSRTKELNTIYTKAFCTAQAENSTVSCSHIPAL